jgi:putative hemolysin
VDPDSIPPPVITHVADSAMGLDTTTLGMAIGLSIVLMILSAIVSAAEVGFLSLKPNDIADLEEEKSTTSDRIIYLEQRINHVLASILICNTIINIAWIITLSMIIHYWMTPQVIDGWVGNILWFTGLSAAYGTSIGNVISIMISMVIIVFVVVTLGEALPKMYAKINYLSVVRKTSGWVSAIIHFLRPVTMILAGWTDLLEKNASHNANPNSSSKEDIDAAIDLMVSSESGTTSQEADMLKGIVNFGDISVREIMHPRVNIAHIYEEDNYKEVMKVVKDSGYSRLPVCRVDLDKVIGILYVKDLIPYHGQDENFNWRSLIRNTVVYVPEAKKIDELLREFQKKRAHMAIVVDEYGGTLGLATLEDIMEEVVGDIKDEFDQEENLNYHMISPNNYVFDGKAELKEVTKIVKLPQSFFESYRKEADSLGGLVVEMIGQIPSTDRVELHLDHVTIKVIKASKKRIEKISLTIHE